MRRLSVAVSLFLFSLGFSLHAQELLGGISGTVIDSSEAGVPGAVVTIRNLDTNFELKTTTQSSGAYLAPNLQIGISGGFYQGRIQD